MNITEGITENQYVVNLIIENADDDVDVTIHVENEYGEFRHNILVSSIIFSLLGIHHKHIKFRGGGSHKHLVWLPFSLI